ncbi:PepSY domain-containing protein [Pokkaliibacter sp. CJK22405]|uniref:PepSY domain-containing protein n=1 Tax=Pokkaliibacter sp. CJK22405 TaxID=3384615 RepID=UPI003984A1D2
MNKKLLQSTLALTLLGAALGNVALADPTCTDAPKDKWMTQDAAKAKIQEMGYSIKKFKETKTGCYELYGKSAEGKRVEIYFDPVTMNKVKEED